MSSVRPGIQLGHYPSVGQDVPETFPGGMFGCKRTWRWLDADVRVSAQAGGDLAPGSLESGVTSGGDGRSGPTATRTDAVFEIVAGSRPASRQARSTRGGIRKHARRHVPRVRPPDVPGIAIAGKQAQHARGERADQERRSPGTWPPGTELAVARFVVVPWKSMAP